MNIKLSADSKEILIQIQKGFELTKPQLELILKTFPDNLDLLEILVKGSKPIPIHFLLNTERGRDSKINKAFVYFVLVRLY